MSDSTDFVIGGETIPLGVFRDLRLKISETYTGDDIAMPVRVIRAPQPGPTLFVSAAVHGDELIGTGIIHELLHGNLLSLKAGTLLLIPVVNVFGFENQDRYLPDRRDLNRQFPGSEQGSLANRTAHTFMREIVARSQYGIDLHAAAKPRTNFPNVRGDLKLPEVERIARAFGAQLIVDGAGPEGSMRREACALGCATIILEAGEPLKVDPEIVQVGVRGVRNVLAELGMLEIPPREPVVSKIIRRTVWIRAEVGGFLRFHVTPGEQVQIGQPVASNFTILGDQQNILLSPVEGTVLGMTTLPAVKPGEPVCHIAVETDSTVTDEQLADTREG